MVRDAILDMKERDLLTEDGASNAIPMFDSHWGNIFPEDEDVDMLFCNIIIPEGYGSMIQYTDNEFICQFKSDYIPDTRSFRIRFVALQFGKYTLIGTIRGLFGVPVNSFALSKNIAAPISASMLRYIDLDGEYLVRLVQNSKSDQLDKAYIYSAKSTDIAIGFSDDQSAQLLSLCAPGNYYRYPLTGVGVTRYLNRVIEHSDLHKVLQEQFEEDQRPVREAIFDNESGKLNLLFSPEKEQSDTGLTAVDKLEGDFFKHFTDEYIRRNLVLNEVDDSEFISILDKYQNILSLFIFIDETTSVHRIASKIESGQFNGFGDIIPSDEYIIVSGTLEANSIIMFDDELEDSVNGAPIFIVNENDETRLYTSLVEQPYWLSETCHKCFILKRRATVKYMIKRSQFLKEKGLFAVPMISSNLKNMFGMVQDVNTGRLLGIVARNTNINDITLDEITQYIYVSQLNQYNE